MTENVEHSLVHIAQAVAHGRYRYTVHAAQQLIARGIRQDEVEQAVTAGELVESYPQHHLGPACMMLGRTREGRPLHVVCSLRPTVDIITVYEPDPAEWETDLRTRKRRV